MNRVNNEIQQLKKNYWEKFSKKMEYNLYGGQKKIWNMLRSRKKPINETVQVNTIDRETWTTHLKTIYREQLENQGENYQDEENISNETNDDDKKR